MEEQFKIKPAPVVSPFFIGNVKIPNPLVLAPLAGITDIVFRRIIKSFGAGLLYTEMISCMAIYYGNKKTLKIAEIGKDEAPISAQIFGSDPYYMSEAAKFLEDKGASIIDINMGCSVPKVVKIGAGAALVRDLKKMAKVIEKVVSSVNIPVTIKIRKGWSSEEITAPQVCRIAYELGVKAVAIHGRTSSQKFSGKADWDFIKQIKETSPIPIIGNGDITTPEEALQKLKNSGCDAIMIGREAYLNPWIFSRTLKLMQEGTLPPPPSYEERKKLMVYHLQKMVERFGEEMGVQRMRKFMAWYVKGLPHSSKFREEVFKETSLTGALNKINEYFSFLS